MRFSIRFNSASGDVRQVVRLAAQAEAVGFETVWYCQDLLRRDAWVVLTAIAAATERIRIGTAIVNPFTSDPAELAMRAATLQEFSRGRFVLGIGPGEQSFLDWVGRRASLPRTGLAEAVGLIRRLLRGEVAAARGRVFTWTDEAFMRMPLPSPSPPIYLGGQGRRMIELMGEIGDGGLPVLFPPDYLTDVLSYVRAGAARSGRDPDDVDIAGCIWYSVAQQADAARAVLRPLVAYYGPALRPQVLKSAGLHPDDFEPVRRATASGEAEAAVTDAMFRLAVIGTPEDVIRHLEALRDKGLRHVNLGPPLGPDPAEALRLTGEFVIPALRDR